MRCPRPGERAWSISTTALLCLVTGALSACGPDPQPRATARPSDAALTSQQTPAAKGECRRFTTCVPENPCHTGWVTGCRANVPICTDIGGWLSNGTQCAEDKVCYLGDCVPCAAGDACQPKDTWGYDITCHAGAIACDTGQPVCQDVGATPDGSACWPGSFPYNVCVGGSCTYCPFGSSCQPVEAPCHVGTVICETGYACQDTGALAGDGTWCGGGHVCHGGECVACEWGAACTPAGMPCWRGYTDCSSGTPACYAQYPAPEGSNCGGDNVCNGNGACVAPCTPGQSCTPYPWNTCVTGTTTCFSPTNGYCMAGPPVADGTSCEGGVCTSGSCVQCGPASWCPSPDACHASGSISCTTGQCEPGVSLEDGASCGGAGETCRAGVCTGVPGSAIRVRSASGWVDLTGTSWTVCEPNRPEPGRSERRTDAYVAGGLTHVEDTFATPDCTGPADTHLEIVASAVTAGDRNVRWANGYPSDGLPFEVTATAIAISAVHPVTGEPIELKDLRFVNDWAWPRRLYEGASDRGLAADGYPTLLGDPARTEMLPCNSGERCASPYSTCEEWAIDCSSGVPACMPTGRPLPEGSWCSGGSCQAGVCVPGPGVRGSRSITYWPDGGPLPPQIANDFYTIGAYWPDAGGGYYPGSAGWDGSFGIAGVPDGPYVLAFSRGLTYFIETDAREVDLGEDLIGRPTATRPFAPTPVTLTVDGLAPWHATDSLQIVCGNTGLSMSAFTQAGAIPEGATSAAGVVEWQWALLDAWQDVAFAFQCSSARVAETSLGFRAASRWAQLPPTTITSGVPAAVSFTLEGVGATGTLTSQWPTGAYEQHLAEINPGAVLSTHRMAVLVKPYATPAIPAGSLPLFPTNAAHLLASRAAASSGDLLLENVAFGRFLPPHWVEYRDVRLVASVPIALPDGTQRTYTGWIARTEELASAAAGAEPVVTPPLAPLVRVGDTLVSAFEPRSGVGTGPLLAWSPPATGAPTSYTVTILSPMAEFANSFLLTAVAVTSRTSFRFPDGLLTPGTTYFAVITARSSERERLDAPLRMQFDADFATAVTATFTP